MLAITAATAAATFSAAAATITAIATTAAAAAPIAPVSTTTATRRTLFAWTGFVDSQRTALEVLGMEHRNGFFRIFFGTHLNKGKAS